MPLRKSQVVLVLAAVFAVVFLMATYGTALPSLPFATVSLNGPTKADAAGEFAAIADTESRRVLILNTDGQLTGVIDCTTFDSPVEFVSDVCVSDGKVFVAGARLAPDSSDIEKERIAIYDKGGNLQDVVYERDYTDDDSSNRPHLNFSFKGLDDAPGGVVLSVMGQCEDDDSSKTSQALSFVYVDEDGYRTIDKGDAGEIGIHDVTYSMSGNHYLVLSIRGMIDDSDDDAPHLFPQRVFTAIDAGEGDTVYACDDASGALCLLTGDGDEREIVAGKGYEDVHANSEFVSVCDREENLVRICDLEGGVKSELTAVTPSIGYSARMVLVWLCSLYLVVLVAVLVVRGVRRRIASGRTENFGPLFASVAVVVAIAVAVGGFSLAEFRQSQNTRANELGMCADYLEVAGSSISAAMERCDDRDMMKRNGKALEDAVTNLQDAVLLPEALVEAASTNGIGLYCVVYGKDEKGLFFLFDSDYERVLGSSVPPGTGDGAIEEAFAERTVDSSLRAGRTLYDATQYRLVQIPTSDKLGVSGVIEVGSKVRSFESSLAAQLVQRVIALIVLALVVFLTYSELRACTRCLFSYRHLRERRSSDAVAVLTRPFTFFITILSSVDGVMTVLIARELLLGAGMGDSSPLLGLPAVMLGVGLMAGQVLYGSLGARVGLRRLMGVGALVMLLCAGFTVIAVSSGVFWLYCVAKLAMSTPFGMLYALGYSMPRVAESDETRAVAAGGVKRTDTSAAALGTVLGGYAAQVFGNAWVYALVGLACLPVLLMALNLLPKGAPPLERAALASSGAPGRGSTAGRASNGVLRLAKNPLTLSIALLVVLPATVAAGYTSFLFPLFSADLGLQKADINNIFVMGQVIVYLCIGRIDAVEARFGKWRVSTVAIAGLGLVFLQFSLNTTLVWSIVVIALVGVLGKSSDGWKAMWLRVAGEADVPAGEATGAMFAARSLALVAQPFILSALLGATDSVAVIVIGAICVVCAIAFYRLTRKTSLPEMR